MSYIVGLVYLRCGNSISNRRVFARNFLLVTMSTALIIMIVKESIALSLGLVGALSIVRFRVAIKEPEEIAYLFLIIAIGIGLGAFQFTLTIIATPIIIGLIIFRTHLSKKLSNSNGPVSNYNINIISKKAKDVGIAPFKKILETKTENASLKHYSEDEESASILVYADFRDTQALDDCRKALVEFENGILIDVVANRAIS